MKKFLKPKFLWFAFWVVAIFTGITLLPNLQPIIATHQNTTKSQVNQQQLTKLQSHWGRGQLHTQQLTIVFNNSRTNLSPAQKTKIEQTLHKLKHNADYYRLRQLRTANTSSNDRQLLTSQDGSTQLAVASIDARQSELSVVAKQLQTATKIDGLKVAVTSPALITQQHQAVQNHQTKQVLLIGAILTFILMGLLFKSLLIPLINLLFQSIVLIGTASLATNLIKLRNWPFTSSSLLPIGSLGLIVTTILTWSLMRDYLAIGDSIKNPDQVAKLTAKRQYQRWGWGLGGLAIALISLSWTPLLATASTWLIAIIIGLALAVVPTLGLAFIALLDDSLRWPSTTAWRQRPKNLWGQFSKFSLWQPGLALLLGLALLIPGFSQGRGHFSYANLNPTILTAPTTAETGNQLISAHFGIGATTPVTIYLQAKTNLTQQNQLQTLDQLTTKLQQVPGVASAVSVTQPAGQKITQYYVGSQLTTVQASLAGNRQALVALEKTLKGNQTTITKADLAAQIQQLKTVQKQLEQLDLDNQQLSLQLTSLSQPTTERATQLNQLATNLAAAETLATQIQAQMGTILTTQADLVTKTTVANNELHKIHQSLGQSEAILKKVTTAVGHTTQYLTGLQASQVGQSFYLPTDAAKSAVYQNSVATNTSADGKLTQLVVTLKQPATSAASQRTLRQVKQTVHASLLATPLATAQVTYSGQTVQTTPVRHALTQQAWQWAALAGGLVALILWLSLRSLLLSGYLMIGLVAIITSSWGLAQFGYTKLAHFGNLPWLALVWSIILITVHWLSISYPTLIQKNWLRSFDAKQLQQQFYHCGRGTGAITMIELALVGPMLISPTTVMQATGLVTILGIILSNLLLPLVLPGLIKWTITPPKFKQPSKKPTAKA
ncbi:MMPL family transporter [Lactiplantibacillus nangangensis]|uniref:MMPL family transporter n=1 Tax=Lactiplantibacillus nangangensis TaxID=2559917 RepID=A0ABW1SLA2_9LACO|nr:MMPL family transporter [Lactiplantibacillus nangangensis]